MKPVKTIAIIVVAVFLFGQTVKGQDTIQGENDLVSAEVDSGAVVEENIDETTSDETTTVENDSVVAESDSTVVVVADTSELIALGRDYFTGAKRFENGGPACITCHNVTASDVVPGGLLAKDLTDAHERLGPGITGFMDSPPTTMKRAYGEGSFTQTEKDAIVMFMMDAGQDGGGDAAQGQKLLLIGGLGVFGVMLVIILLIFRDRKRRSTKKDIFDRQINAIN